MVVNVTTAAKVFTVVFAVIERLDLVTSNLNATVSTTKILLYLIKFI